MHPKLKTGLKAGCIVLSLAGLIILGGLIFFMREMGQNYKQVEATEEILLETYGPPVAYAPPGLGLPAADRVELFLAIREDGAEWRRRVESAFLDYLAARDDPGGSGPGRFIRVFQATTDLSPVLAGFWTARNEALIEAGMGPGEYIWLYGLVYHAWLGFDPAEGVKDAWTVLPGVRGSREPDALEAARRERELARQRVAETLLPIMKTILAGAAPQADPGPALWLDEMGTEVARMEDDPVYLPWVGRLPPAAAAGFVPHQARLRAAYSRAVNPVELMFGPVFGSPEDE